MQNIEITDAEMMMLRLLPDFDLQMVLSDISEFGWDIGRKTLVLATKAVAFEKERGLRNGEPIQ